MPTKIIGLSDRFCNFFTKSGRQRNSIYKEMKEIKLQHIRERKLRDNSRVILGYKTPESEYANLAYKVKPDLSTVRKAFDKIGSLFQSNVVIEKVRKNYLGEKTGQEVINAAYDDGNLVEKTISTLNKYGSSYIKQSRQNSDYYKYFQLCNGTRLYKKSRGGVEYSFSTKSN